MQPMDDIVAIKVSLARMEEQFKSQGEYMRVMSANMEAMERKLDQLPSEKDLHRTNERIAKAEKKLEDHDKEFDQIHSTANKWKGGLLVIIAIGSFINWIGSSFGSLSKFFTGGGGV